jgi:hypothetical protein
LRNVHREKRSVESLRQGNERGPIYGVFSLPMIMRSDQQLPIPEEEAIFFAHRILPRTFPTGAQGNILLHDEASEECLSLLPSQILCDPLEVLPARTFRDESGFMPKVFCGFDVVFDHKGAITQLTS